MFNKNGDGVLGALLKVVLVFSTVASIVLMIDDARHEEFRLYTSSETRIFDKDDFYSFSDLLIFAEDTEKISDETETGENSVTADIPVGESVKVDDASAAIDSETEPTTGTVYWVKNGEVWHISEKCPSLSRSKSILSGTVSEAKENGKARVCKRCGQ